MVHVGKAESAQPGPSTEIQLASSSQTKIVKWGANTITEFTPDKPPGFFRKLSDNIAVFINKWVSNSKEFFSRLVSNTKKFFGKLRFRPPTVPRMQPRGSCGVGLTLECMFYLFLKS
jgi:hypothetical protein